ncbi:hypothetical protein WA026_004670 [Henosepilachna vigintioctopunctata]|uniref:Uncharacterized protein n=1 Tax=Henosepilachna vigintioctopunctata TaxID=420089 RepID=A0AAW1V790_9CUCU
MIRKNASLNREVKDQKKASPLSVAQFNSLIFDSTPILETQNEKVSPSRPSTRSLATNQLDINSQDINIDIVVYDNATRKKNMAISSMLDHRLTFFKPFPPKLPTVFTKR